MTNSIPCAECGAAVMTPHKSWSVGDPTYCPEHRALLSRDPRFVIPDAISAAERDMMQPASELVRWCLPELDELLGFLLPGTVTYGCAFPKNGKTAFVANNLAFWEREGVRPWVMPTESRPKGLITRLACARLGLSTDDVMSRRLRVRFDAGDRDAFRDMTALMAEFSKMSQTHREEGAMIAIEPAPRLTRSIFRKSMQAAAAGGYGLVVVDHCDHIGGDPETGENGYVASEGVQHDALEFAELYELPVLMMSQLNTSRVNNDLLHRYKRPVADWLWMKGVKDQIATTLFGIYRPMQANPDDKLLAAIKSGEAESWRVAMPNTMGIADMLSRFNGGKADRSLLLHYEDGTLRAKSDAEAWDAQSGAHGISTGSPSLYRGRAA